ncbi:MAG: hypothetical protein R2724_32615 [Bryobacterales bacterium]
MVREGLREIPIDPFTESRDTWEIVTETGPTGQSGVWNVFSGLGQSLNGTLSV